MDYRKLGRTGLKISELCLGTMTFGWIDEADSFAIMDRAWEAGINCFDTADVYSRWVAGNTGGEAETVLGKWLQSKPRDQLVLATKVRAPMGDGPNDQGLSRAHIMRAVEDSLRRLGTDYLDLYQAHWPDDETPLDETLRALDDLVRQGKVRYLGASNHRAWQLVKALWVSDTGGYARYDCLQPHYHLLNRAEVEPDLRDVCLDQDLGLIPYSPLAGGFLTGKYAPGQIPAGARGETSEKIRSYMTETGFAVVQALRELGAARGKTIAQLALGWLLTQPHVTAPIIGAHAVDQLNESLGAVGLRLDADELARLDELTMVA